MGNELIHDRGRGPELVGTRITVYNLLPYFLDPTATEALICRMYELTPEQVAAARADVFRNADTILARHLGIEAQLAAGNPPEVLERAKQTHATFVRFKEWLSQREQAEAEEDAAGSTVPTGNSEPARLPTFREWLAAQESRPEQGS